MSEQRAYVCGNVVLVIHHPVTASDHILTVEEEFVVALALERDALEAEGHEAWAKGYDAGHDAGEAKGLEDAAAIAEPDSEVNAVLDPDGYTTAKCIARDIRRLLPECQEEESA